MKMLRKLVGDHRLTFEELTTVLTEVEAHSQQQTTFTSSLHFSRWIRHAYCWSLLDRQTPPFSTLQGLIYQLDKQPATLEIGKSPHCRSLESVAHHLSPIALEEKEMAKCQNQPG